MKIWFLVLLLFSILLNAQSSSKNEFDVVRDYLYEVQQAVDYAPNTKKEKVERLNKVIGQGKDSDEILREFNLLLQAIILLETDIHRNTPLSQDIDYLNKSIPRLLKKLQK